MGQSSKHGLGYTEITNIAATAPKIVFVKDGVTSNVATTSKIVSIIVAVKTVNTRSSGKNSTPSLSGGKKRFVFTCHFCNRPSHICPKYFKYQNIFKMVRFGKYNHNSRVAAYKPKNASKHTIDLKNNHAKKI